MAKTYPESINLRAHKAFDKVKLDVEALKKENVLLKEQLNNFDFISIAEMRRELTLLRDKQEMDVEKLKSGIAKCTCSENKADINDLRRDIAKINFSSIKDEVRSLNTLVREHSKELKNIHSSVDKVLLSDSVSQRLDELEEDLEERLDTLERMINSRHLGSSTKSVKEDEVIERFASSYEPQEGKKSFKKWLFSKEQDTDDINEVK